MVTANVEIDGFSKTKLGPTSDVVTEDSRRACRIALRIYVACKLHDDLVRKQNRKKRMLGYRLMIRD